MQRAGGFTKVMMRANVQLGMNKRLMMNQAGLARVAEEPTYRGLERLGKVQDIINIPEMSRRIGTWTIDENETVYTATRKMMERRIGYLCVTRNDQIVGMFTERDYLTSVLHAGRTSESTRVKEIATMEEDLVVANPQDNVNELVNIMIGRGIRHLPIVEQGTGQVVALLGMEDLAAALARPKN
jgi:CBS domain-containing protein